MVKEIRKFEKCLVYGDKQYLFNQLVSHDLTGHGVIDINETHSPYVKTCFAWPQMVDNIDPFNLKYIFITTIHKK